VKLLADENLHRAIVRSLLRRLPSLDVVRVQDVGLSGADDATVLAWAASEGRIVLTSSSDPLPVGELRRVASMLYYAWETAMSVCCRRTTHRNHYASP